MGEIKYITEKNRTTKESGFKIGDILCGTTHMYHTETHWYRIVDMTAKLLTLEKMDVSYPTQYMSNTPGDESMPVLNVNGRYYLAEGFPYWPGHIGWGIVTASVRRTKRYDSYNEDPADKPWEYEADVRGDSYAPLLRLWDGKPGWVNCD